MRILIVGTSYFPATNGQAVFTTNLAEGLAKHNHQVMVIFPSDRIRTYQDARNGVKLYGVKSIGFTKLHPDSFLPLFTLGTIQKIVDEFQPQVVHVQDHYPLSHAVVKAAEKHGAKIRKVGTNHFMPQNVSSYLPFSKTFKFFYEWILWKWMLSVYNRMDIVTAQSRMAAKITRSHGLLPPIFPVSCGLDLNRFNIISNFDRAGCLRRYKLDPNRMIFLFVGRVDPEKRLDVLLHALKRIDRDDVQLAIAGEGAAVKKLQSLAESLNLGSRVQFTGFITNEDLPILFNSVDIFSMPSEAELLSIASLEAMACGRPLLLANAVALPELVAPGVNGYLFRSGDPADAARYMKILIENRERWGKMGAASLERAQAHGLEQTIDHYESLYKAALNNDTPTIRSNRYRFKYSSQQ